MSSLLTGTLRIISSCPTGLTSAPGLLIYIKYSCVPSSNLISTSSLKSISSTGSKLETTKTYPFGGIS